MGKGRALKCTYRMDSYCTLMCRPHWELGADLGFTDDGRDSMHQAFFLMVVIACLEMSERYF